MSCLDELMIYKQGTVDGHDLYQCSVCTNVSDRERIEELTNLKNPTGINSRWEISEDKNFPSGEPNPCTCENKPKTHKHYLMKC